VYSEKFPDDGQRNCPKHVEFHSKNKFEKLMHLVGFIIKKRKNISRAVKYEIKMSSMSLGEGIILGTYSVMLLPSDVHCLQSLASFRKGLHLNRQLIPFSCKWHVHLLALFNTVLTLTDHWLPRLSPFLTLNFSTFCQQMHLYVMYGYQNKQGLISCTC